MESNDAKQQLREMGILKTPEETMCCDFQMYETYFANADGEIFRCSKCKARKSIRYLVFNKFRYCSFFEHFNIRLDILKNIIFDHFPYMHSISDVCKEYKLSQKTVSRIYRCIRRLIEVDLDFDYSSYQLGTKIVFERIKNASVEAKEEDIVYEEDEKLYLESPAVEADETLIGHFTEGNSRIEQQTWVFGIWDRGLKEGRCFVVPNRSQESLVPLLQRHVFTMPQFKTRVYTDYLRSYLICDEIDYNHYRVNHTLGFGFNTYTTNHIENYWNQIKNTGLFSSGLFSNDIDYISSVLAESQYRVRYQKQDIKILLIGLIKRWADYIDYSY